MEYLPYDETDPISIETYAQGLIGSTFKDILVSEIKEENELYQKIDYYDNPRSKGGLGNLIEEYYFLYKPNSESAADFYEAGVELKVTPYEVKKNKELKAGERLVLGMIPFDREIPATLEESHIIEKISLMLLVLYRRDRNKKRTDYRIDYVSLLALFSEELKDDFEVLKSDYQIIREKIVTGRAHELSESDTMYLGACTKGSTAKKSLQPQFYNPTVRAKRRAFSLKQGYMTYIINKYIQPGVKTYTPIEVQPEGIISFESLVRSLVAPYIGQTSKAIQYQLGIEISHSKNMLSRLVLNMLGVRGDNAEEFEKSNTIVKTLSFESNGSLRESMSFPIIDYKDFAKEEWEDSWLYKFFSENRFLFAVFQKNTQGERVFKGVKFWNMPAKLLDGTVYDEWKQNQNIIRNNNVTFKLSTNNTVKNNLPKKSQTKVIHMRPHASKSAYRIQSLGFEKGNIERDGNQLPNGDWMTKQCFWLNNSFLQGLLADYIDI